MLKNYINENDHLSRNELLKIHEFLFDNAHDIILYLAEDGRILTANKMAITKYGYTYDELTSMNIQDLRHASMDSTYIDHMTLSECEGIIFEGIHIKKDGSTLLVEVSSRTIVCDGEKLRIHIIRDTTERKRIEESILRLASFDTLTNVANRANIISQLDNSIEKSKLTGNNIALMIFDIDKFKGINDTFGHLVGDKVLKYLAQSIKELLRNDDSIGRFGGDEFIIIQRNVKSKEDVISLISRIFKMLESPAILDNNSIHISISIGICLLSESENRNELIYKADSAMYEAKKTNGCSFEFYSDKKDEVRI